MVAVLLDWSGNCNFAFCKMKTEYVSHTGAPRLILLFAGWAMDAGPFCGLHRNGYDIAIVYDYSDDSADWSFAEGYKEICIVAWSLGVRAAASAGLTGQIDARVTLRLAVNGTETPIDDCFGIPEALFRATADHLTETSLLKFYRRTAGRTSTAFTANAPRRTTESARREIYRFIDGELPPVSHAWCWDRAIVSTADAVFPPENQLAAWREIPVATVDGAAHMPDFQLLLDRYVIDKDYTAQCFSSSSDSYEAAASVQDAVVDQLMRIAQHAGLTDNCRHVIEVGCGTGLLSRRLAATLHTDGLEMWDITGKAPTGVAGTFRCGDAELMIRDVPDGTVDAIISASTLQWFNSPLCFVRQCARALKPRGILVFSTFGPDNLMQTSALTGLALPCLSAGQWQELHFCGLELLYAGQTMHTMYFDTAADIFRHLRQTGVNSLKHGWYSGLRRALTMMRPDDSGKYPLTYNPVFLAYSRTTSDEFN